VITRAMDLFENHQEAISWSERRNIALLLERCVLSSCIAICRDEPSLSYAPMEAHLPVLRPSLSIDFSSELYSAAQAVQRHIKVTVSPARLLLGLTFAIPCSWSVPGAVIPNLLHQVDILPSCPYVRPICGRQAL
jgi:hypothetical protein